MKNTYVKAAAAVPSVTIGLPAANAAETIKLMQAHADCGVIVFPELGLTACTCGDLFAQSALLDAAEAALLEVAAASVKLPGQTAVVGLPLRFEGSLFNCAAFVSGGEVAGIVPKSFIPAYGSKAEGRWFSSGEKIIGREIMIGGVPVPFGIDVLAEDTVSGAVIGALLSEDLFVPDSPAMHAAMAGAQIIAVPAAFEEAVRQAEYRRHTVVHASRTGRCAFVFASAGNDESTTDLVYSGQALLAANGHLKGESIMPEASHVITALIDLEELMHERYAQNTFAAADSTWYRHVPVSVKPCGKPEMTVNELKTMLVREKAQPQRLPFVPADYAEKAERSMQILRIQAAGLIGRLKRTGIRTLVIGVSGGLDSTLALIVCHEAKKRLPDIRTIGITMPSQGNTTDLTKDNALRLMEALQVESREIPIRDTVESHLMDIGHPREYQGEGDTAYENAQARMRTMILMDVANMENGLVVGTGDLSELALGWCTYNGDHMSMYDVNGDVPKTLVRHICDSYADLCGNKELHDVLKAVIGTPISPELTPNKKGRIAQKTEEKIGKYDLNDFFLYQALRYGYAPDKVIGLAMAAYPEIRKPDMKEAALRFYRRFFSQQFKRSCMPDGPKVGTIDLSPRGDWHMPSDASAALWLDIIKNC
ncbi:MAG: NAD(+) synthase [Solobacterium sp.]|nr:NAD(+) synthase [Solobacterium sp.]